MFIYNDIIVFISGRDESSTIFLYSIIGNTMETIYVSKEKITNLKYNEDDIILFITEENIKVYSLSEKKIINTLKNNSKYFDFINKEIMIGSKFYGDKTNFYIYNVITGLLIKYASINLETHNIKCVDVNNFENKLQQYLNNFK
ncbi:hypothetical protein H012_gp146 [Acanthamoeba polyphaga moumouvirus]|uniref:Uncharacterized protein n=1 Tax=Acanthamoeba polyphaga moumouvirus TaxID=1269028 RepID=L7RCH9_9VIRU|nr:hypothetical protein H012_gp146 [Acanthamoeba polyphaga moumouvirus]AGC02304.1 hypothetical protein Moumou_00786 [Acanthamoeba polyphaga moumouvirus]